MSQVGQNSTVPRLLIVAILMTGILGFGANQAMAQAPTGVLVGKGGVGESGASAIVFHKLAKGRESKVIVRTDKSSLCPNTGVIAVLVVNGEPVKFGRIDDSGSAIKVKAKPDDDVVVLVHTIPLFNDIACIRLGELEFSMKKHGLE